MDIIYNVAEGFYSLYRAMRTLDIAKEKLKNSIETLRISKLMAEAGRLPEGDLMTAEIAVAQDEVSVSEKKGTLDKEKDLFKLLIGMDLDSDFEILPRLKTDEVAVDLDVAVKEGLKNRLEIPEAEIDIELQKISIDRAKREREFKGSISGYYDITGVSTLGSGSVGDLFKSSLNNFNDRPPNRGLTFTISYPISDWGRGKSRLHREEVELLNRELDLDNLKNTIIIEIRDIVRTFNENKEKFNVHEKNQELARRNYKIMELRFENGDISSQDLAIERERLSDIQIAYLDSYIAYQLALADLKRKTMWDFQNRKSYRIDNTYEQQK
jgi:outer membrane protein TolC